MTAVLAIPRPLVAASGGIGRNWLLACAALAGVAHYCLATGPDGFGAPNPMLVLAAIAIVADVRRLPSGDSLGGLSWALFAIALLACATPFRIGAAPALACAGLLAWRATGISGRSAGVLLVALAGWVMKDGAWAEFASSPILTAEAHLTRWLLGLGGIPGSAVSNRIVLADGQSFVVLRACSVLSLAYPCAIGTYSLSRLLRPNLAPGAGRVCAALGLLLTMNTARLVAMAASPAVYRYMHRDTGVIPLQIAWATIVVLVACPSWRRR